MINYDIQNHKPLRDIVYQELKTQIMTGSIKPGTRIMEVEIAEEMGVSRTPIREAIRKLEKEGFVTIEPRKGVYAADLSVYDMVEALEVRQTLEGLAAGLAAERITDEQREALIECTENFNKAVAEENSQDMIHFDTKLHHLIVEASDNKVLVDMVSRLQELVLRFRYLYFSDFKRSSAMPEEHKQIVDAVCSGDAEKAREAADIHIDRLKELILNENL